MPSTPTPDRSLAGRAVVVTRARDRAREMVEALELRGARAVVFPTIELRALEDTRALDEALTQLERFDMIIFGSKSAAEIVFARAEALGVDVRTPIACVGAKTRAFVEARLADRAAECVVLSGDVYRAEALVDRVVAALGSVAGRRFLFPRAPEGREVIMDLLEARGARVEALSVYRIEALPPATAEALRPLEDADAFTFLSGETLRAFLEVVPEATARAWLDARVVGVIGPVAKERAAALGVRVDVVPETATIEALVAALAARLGPKV